MPHVDRPPARLVLADLSTFHACIGLHLTRVSFEKRRVNEKIVQNWLLIFIGLQRLLSFVSPDKFSKMNY